MYRVVIADDEPLIIRGLRKMIDWTKLNTEIVGEAEDGGELLELLDTLEPDIIVSDISMPQKSGLDVLKEIKSRGLKTKVIFLSGFQEFSYARDAVTYGAVDYLLKPVTVEELETAVKRAQKQIVQEHPENFWQAERDSVEQEFRELSSLTVPRKKRKLQVSRELLSRGDCFVGVCFVLTGSLVKQIRDSNRFELMRFAIFKQIEEYLNESERGFVAKRAENSSSVVLVLPGERPYDRIEDTVQKIREIIRRKYGVSLIAGIGEITDDVKKLEFIYKTSKFSAGIYYFTGEETIFYRDIDRTYEESFEDFEKLCKALIRKLISRDEDWRDAFGECLNMIRNIHYGSRYAAESRCVIMAMEIYSSLMECKLAEESGRKKFEQEVEGLRGLDTYEELKTQSSGIMERFVNEFILCRGRQENDAVFKVKEYIREHFTEDITLEKMAQLVYMNPYYFSAFFKKETGENFKTYLLEVRMKKALQYLLETDVKTSELAESVGYHDVRTFTDKFKEFYGSSPMKYKKILQNK